MNTTVSTDSKQISSVRSRATLNAENEWNQRYLLDTNQSVRLTDNSTSIRVSGSAFGLGRSSIFTRFSETG